jgi:tRNA nucleotidyltransferase (CCA-adding enzyme)
VSVRPRVPEAARWITRMLEEAGHETWTVGGGVRDAILGRPSDEWDLATHARPGQVRRIFKRTVPIGMEHGTVGVLARDGTMYEVTTFRRDVETDGRHAVIAFAETLDEDLARRDFTVNAIAWHAIREELHDPYDGAGDLERHVLRTVGEPTERFSEDYLRILRGLRFAGRFSLHVESGTWEALCAGVDRLTGLSAERIREELLKVLSADPAPERALKLYAESGSLRVLYPELDALRRRPLPGGSRGATEWTLAVLSATHLPPGRPYLRLAALLRGVAPPAAAALLTRLRLSNAQTDEVARLAAAAPLPAADSSDVDVRRWLSAHGAARLNAVGRLDLARSRAASSLGLPDGTADAVAAWRAARAIRRTHPPLTLSDLALDGRGLIALGLRPGPEFGLILDELLSWVLEDPERNVEERLAARVLSEHVTGAGPAGSP